MKRIKFEKVSRERKKLNKSRDDYFPTSNKNKFVFGVTTWSNVINLEDIWRLTKDEDKFTDLFTVVDTHELLHGLILENFYDGMENTILQMHPNIQKIIKRRKKKKCLLKEKINEIW